MRTKSSNTKYYIVLDTYIPFVNYFCIYLNKHALKLTTLLHATRFNKMNVPEFVNFCFLKTSLICVNLQVVLKYAILSKTRQNIQKMHKYGKHAYKQLTTNIIYIIFLQKNYALQNFLRKKDTKYQR